MSNIPLVNSHNSWSQLEEVWLGDVYPASWYEHLESQVRDVFQQLTDITQHDLQIIQNTLENLGVVVRRPRYENISDYLEGNDQLTKPQICPRDQHLTLGNTFYYHDWHSHSWQHCLDLYAQDKRVILKPNKESGHINGANVVRVGKDIIIDSANPGNDFTRHVQQDYRLKLVNNGGHLDACFAVLKPGLLLANRYFSDYENTFPGWEIIMLDHPSFGLDNVRRPYPNSHGKFWDATVPTNRMFNQHVITHALDWVGCYTETYFELNCLVINEKNVVMLGENAELQRQLSTHGITVHWVPFRLRSFWDGAMHCLTVDIRRQSTIEDFFPERG
jgi:hypothetical protein